MRLGQVQLLLHAVAEAAAEQSARADGDLTHGGLKAGVAHIRERVEPDIHAVAYMLERQIRGDRAESGEDACRDEEPDAQTGGDQHDETDAAGDDDRGVMRLLREQENIDREQRAVWVEQLFPVLHVAVLRGRPRREADDDRVLRELGRLKAEQPARRALGRRADARNEHQDQQENAERDRRDGQIFIVVIVPLAQQEHGNKAALRVQRVRVARREQRDQADEQQQQRCAHGRHIDRVRLSRASLRLCRTLRGRRAVGLPRHRLARGTRRRIGCAARCGPSRSPAAARAARLSC